MTRRAAARWLFLVAAASAVTAPGPARADDDAEGRRLFRRGEELLNAGRYQEAAQAFEAGYLAAPRVGFLLDIGNCYRKLGELGKARQSYWRFLDAAPKDHPSRPEVLEYLRAMEEIEADGVAVEPVAASPGRPPALVSPEAPAARPAPAASVTAVAPAPAARPTPLLHRWWVWGLAAVAVAVGAAAFALGHRSGGPSCAASLGCARE